MTKIKVNYCALINESYATSSEKHVIYNNVFFSKDQPEKQK
jgi:hypothetical protein